MSISKIVLYTLHVLTAGIFCIIALLMSDMADRLNYQDRYMADQEIRLHNVEITDGLQNKTLSQVTGLVSSVSGGLIQMERDVISVLGSHKKVIDRLMEYHRPLKAFDGIPEGPR